MSVYTALGIGIVLLMVASAYVGEWAGIIAFTISLLMIFELDLHTEAERSNDDET